MKKIMIIDDDPSIVKMLSIIIEDNNLGKVVTTLYSGEYAVEEILFIQPDIVLIDLLLPISDGIKIIKESKNGDFNGKFIMISQVEDHQMISRAYSEGTLFYISKPINSNEVISIVREVSRVIDLEKSVAIIQGALRNFSTGDDNTNKESSFGQYNKKIDNVFSDLGIGTESGVDDLRAVLHEIIKYRKLHNDNSYQLQDIYTQVSGEENNRTVEQRIRRVIIKAFSNIAELGYEDYYNPIFAEYSSLLFDIKQVRIEMRRINDKDKPKGKTNVKKFIEGIIAKINKIDL